MILAAFTFASPLTAKVASCISVVKTSKYKYQ